MAEPDFVVAHKNATRNRKEIENSDLCGCFYCIHIFRPSKIVEWIDDDSTAMCPDCGIDSVIGSKSGYSITIELLEKMRNHWFGQA